jgi:flagellin
MGAAAVEIMLSDIDSDGVKDLLVATNFGSLNRSWQLNVASGRANGGFGVFSEALSGAGDITGIAIGDLNRDGRNDLALSVSEDSGTTLRGYTYMGDGRGNFTQRQSYSTSTTSSSLIIADLNGDGWNDLVEERDDGTLGARLGGGNGTVGNFIQAAASSDGVKGFLLSDFNNDGVLDLYDGSPGLLQGETRDGVSPLELFSLKSRASALQSLPKFAQLLERLSLQRGQVGALRSRYEATLNVTRSSADNLGAASSRITDADVAESSAALVRSQILQNISSVVLSQANRSSQITLDLLR